MYVTTLQVGGHVPIVTSHLWLSEWQHPYFMNAITIHNTIHTELWQMVTNERVTGALHSVPGTSVPSEG